jgi:hypothetical protein
MDPHQRITHSRQRRDILHGPSPRHNAMTLRCRSDIPGAGTVAVDRPDQSPLRTGHAEPRNLP